MAEDTAAPSQGSGAARDWRAWLQRFRKPGPAEIGIMAGGAAVVALAVAGLLWSSGPDYAVLYRGLSEADAGQIMESLVQSGVAHRVDRRTGDLLVPEDSVHETRLKLATQGLPRGAVDGFEMLDEQNSLGVSQFMENARHHRALEGELARSIMSVGAVEQARVHLALPKESVFVRQKQPPSASVLVKLHPGRVLDAGQVAAIVHMVSSSVPRLTPERVSLVDQAGSLLTRPGGTLGQNLDQMDYTRRLEERYVRRIEDLLTPVLGLGAVRAQVALELDFSVTEETAEYFDPGQGMLRSEQVMEEQSNRAQPLGIPGALSNQPPGVAIVPETLHEGEAPLPTDAQAQADSSRPLRQRQEATRNYELDRRVSHTRTTPGRISRISTAVVVDDRVVAGEGGVQVREPLGAEELARIEALVRQAVGFDAGRGDTVSVLNATFAASPFHEAPLPVWRQAWFLELVKWAVIALVSLAVLVLVVRPVMRRLLPPPASKEEAAALAGPGEVMGREQGMEGLLDDRVELGAGGAPRLGAPEEQLERRLKVAKALVAEDPKRAVQVIKDWIASEA